MEQCILGNVCSWRLQQCHCSLQACKMGRGSQRGCVKTESGRSLAAIVTGFAALGVQMEGFYSSFLLAPGTFSLNLCNRTNKYTNTYLSRWATSVSCLSLLSNCLFALWFSFHSLCHYRVHLCPHKSQVLIYLFLERGRETDRFIINVSLLSLFRVKAGTLKCQTGRSVNPLLSS